MANKALLFQAIVLVLACIAVLGPQVSSRLRLDTRSVDVPPWFLSKIRSPVTWAFLVFLSTYGYALVRFGFSPDSMGYVDVARNLAAGNGVSSWILWIPIGGDLPQPNSIWPPLYPAAIALGLKLGLDAALTARLIPIIAISLVVFPIYGISRHLFGQHVAIATAALLPLYAPFLIIGSMAWSEALFLCLSLASVWLLVATQATGRKGPASLGFLVLSGFLMGLATMTRYMGFAFILGGGLYFALMWLLQRESRKGAALMATAWLFPAVLTPGLWLVRNALVASSLMGARSLPSTVPLGSNLLLTVKAFGKDHFAGFLAPVKDVLPVTEIIILSFGVLFTIALVFVTPKLLRHGAGILNLLFHHNPAQHGLLLILMGGAYVSVLVVARSLWHFDPIDTRLMTPFYPFALILLVGVIFWVYRRRNGQSYQLCALAIILAGAGVVAFYALQITEAAKSRYSLDGYSQIRSLPAARWIAENTDGNALIIGNRAWQYNFAFGRPVVAIPPRPFSSYTTWDDLRQVVARAGDSFDHIYLILQTGKAYDRVSLEEYGPFLNGLAIDPEQEVPGLTLIYRAVSFAVFEVERYGVAEATGLVLSPAAGLPH